VSAASFARALAGVSVLTLCACARVVFDHERAALQEDAGSDAGEVVPESCEGLPDDALCDDRNVCSTGSRCTRGECLPRGMVEPCVVADTSDDYSAMQGGNGWFNGYWDLTADEDGTYDPDADYRPMEHCPDNNWRPLGRCDTDREMPGYRWTSNLAWGLQHPETMPNIEVPIRRWVSDASGPARVSIEHKTGGVYSDGTRAMLVIDGEEVYRSEVAGGDELGAADSIEVELELGMRIDQLVHPLDTSADDTTFFEIRIEGR
jgi:hypothetical protein